MKARLPRTSLSIAATLGLCALAQAQLPPAPFPPENPPSEAKRLLGKALFWDEQLSSDDTTACGSCHRPESGGADPRTGTFGAIHPGMDAILGTFDDKFASPGVLRQDLDADYQPDALFGFERRVTERKAPSNIGAGHFPLLFWDGRAEGSFFDPESGALSIVSGGALESLSVVPILNTVEMAHEGRTWDEVRAKLERVRPLALAFGLNPDLTSALAGGTRYPDLFADAFGDEGITAERIAYALASYQRSLNPDQTPWDRFAAGDTSALTSAQVQGLNAFTGSTARCDQCHHLPLFSDGEFHNLGLRPIVEDSGRQAISGNPADRGRFKVPSLRNVGLRLRMMHDGEFIALPQIMTFYTGGGGPFPENKDPLLQGISVPPGIAVPIANFLANGLTDPRLAAGLPPFDRPRLHSERPTPNPELSAGAIPGSGGFAPRMLALVPPRLGSRDFKLGLSRGLGSAPGFVTFHLSPPGLVGPARRWSLQLSAGPAGGGYATFHQDLPNDPNLAGLELWSQFWILDPGAVGGFAKSEIAHYTLF